jgi:hypothetical protein
MTGQNALAALGNEQPQPMVRSEEELRVMMAEAKRFVDSGLLPKAIDTPQKALLIMAKARELGVPPSYALSNISVIGGKPAAGAEMLLGLVYRAYGGNALRVRVSTRERCVVRYQRPEWPDASEEEWTIQDAKDAGLLNSDAWKKYPKTMLRWRAISAACKVGFPEVIGGLYTPEELGARVEITEAGEAYIDSLSDIPARLTGSIDAASDEAEVGGDDGPSDEPVQRSEWDEFDESQAPLFDEFERATPAQLQSIEKLRSLLGLPQDIGDLSSDEANEMIARLSQQYSAAKAKERGQ